MSSVYAVLWYICQEQLLAFSESRKLNGGTKRFPLSVNNLYYFIIFSKCPQFSFLLFLFTSLLFFVLCIQLKDSSQLTHFLYLISNSSCQLRFWFQQTESKYSLGRGILAHQCQPHSLRAHCVQHPYIQLVAVWLLSRV